MTVTFMKWQAVYFVKDQTALENEINSGLVVVKPASAEGRFNGYPAFENTLNGKFILVL